MMTDEWRHGFLTAQKRARSICDGLYIAYDITPNISDADRKLIKMVTRWLSNEINHMELKYEESVHICEPTND